MANKAVMPKLYEAHQAISIHEADQNIYSTGLVHEMVTYITENMI